MIFCKTSITLNYRKHLAFVFLGFLMLFCLFINQSAQAQKPSKSLDSPIFKIRVQQTGQSDGVMFSSTLEQTYAPCSQWVGGSGGWQGTPSEFISNAGGLGGLKPKMNIPFYIKEYTGSANGSDGSKAHVVTIGDGLGLWTEQSGNNTCTKQDNSSDYPSRKMNALFERTESGARITFDAGLVSAGCASYIGFVNMYQMEVDPALVKRFCTFELTNEELNKWQFIKKNNVQTFSDDNGKLTANASLYVEIKEPEEVKVEIEDYVSWIPKANPQNAEKSGNSIKIKATVLSKDGIEKPKEAKITFLLNYVSEEPGICINGPVVKGLDMRFTKEENDESKFEVSTSEVKTKEYVDKTQVVVSSFDFGAYAELRVIAVDRDGKPLKVTFQGNECNNVPIPKTELGSRIANAWLNKEEVIGLSDDWDEVEVAGQSAKGDGLDLYAKYRGVLTIDNAVSPEHIRLHPKEKVHFVIDKSNKFDFSRWYASTKIRAYRVNDQITREKQVDYNSSSASRSRQGGKYAVECEIVKGLIEKDPLPLSEAEKKAGKKPGDDPLQYGCTVGNKPREIERSRIYPDRIHAMIVRVVTKMNAALANPDAPENAEEMSVLSSLGIPLESIKERLKAIDENEIKILTEMMVKLSAIHEMAHACGVDGHMNNKGLEDETLLRTPSCPMNYLYTKERRQFVLFRKLGGEGVFCSNPPDNCWKQLNVK